MSRRVEKVVQRDGSLVGGPRLKRAVPAIILGGSLALSLVLYFGYLGSGLVDHVARWTASSSSLALNLLGSSTSVDGTVLRSSGFAVDIVGECTAVGPIVLFMGAVAAYPAGLRAKAAGVALGVVLLSAVNLVRVISLFWLGSAFPQYLDVAHVLIWQTALIVIVIVLWLAWTERIAHARNA